MSKEAIEQREAKLAKLRGGLAEFKNRREIALAELEDTQQQLQKVQGNVARGVTRDDGTELRLREHLDKIEREISRLNVVIAQDAAAVERCEAQLAEARAEEERAERAREARVTVAEAERASETYLRAVKNFYESWAELLRLRAKLTLWRQDAAYASEAAKVVGMLARVEDRLRPQSVEKILEAQGWLVQFGIECNLRLAVPPVPEVEAKTAPPSLAAATTFPAATPTVPPPATTVPGRITVEQTIAEDDARDQAAREIEESDKEDYRLEQSEKALGQELRVAAAGGNHQRANQVERELALLAERRRELQARRGRARDRFTERRN